MPTKRKTAKKKTTHKRKVGGMSSKTTDALQLGAGAAIGAAGGWYVYTTQKTITDNLMGALQIGAGVLALLFVDMPLIKGLGLGLMGSGAIIEGESLGFLSGVTNLPSNQSQLRIAGPGAVHQLGNIPGGRFPGPGAVGASNTARKYAGVYKR